MAAREPQAEGGLGYLARARRVRAECLVDSARVGQFVGGGEETFGSGRFGCHEV